MSSGAFVAESTVAVAEEIATAPERVEIEEVSFALDYDREVAYLVLEGTIDAGMVPRAVKHDGPA